MTPAIEAARLAGIEYRVREFECEADRDYGLAAAAALGVSPERVYKTLIAKLDGKQLIVALVPVSAGLNLKALAVLAGGKRAEMATPQEAERSSGYVVGGISLLGQRRRLPTYADASLASHPTVYINGGRRGLDIELAPDDLLACCAAQLGGIAR